MKPAAGDAGKIIDALERQSGRPLRAMVEVADRCNEVCVHCYQEQGNKGEMSTEELKGLFDQLAAMGILVLTISGGEATLRKDFVELVRYARDRGFLVRIFTNGLTMTRELARELAEIAVDVVEISLYSHRAQVHDFVTGVAGSFDRTVAGIRHLVESGVAVHVKTPVMSLNENETDVFAEFVSALGATYALDPGALMAREGGDREPERWSRSQATYEALYADRRFGEAPKRRNSASNQRALCGAGATVHVEPDGQLRPCTMLDVDLGHALREGVANAREHSQSLRDLRQLKWSDVHGCRDCDLRSYCHRCHATALSEAGDALAPYPTACANARSRYGSSTGVVPQFAERSAGGPFVGPFRAVSEGVFEPIDDKTTQADDDLADRLGWIRRPPDALPDLSSSTPDGLVQLRRPGRKRARTEPLPGAKPASSTTLGPDGGGVRPREDRSHDLAYRR